MGEMKLVMAGNRMEPAISAIIEALGTNEDAVQRKLVKETSDAERRIVDPISLATLVLTIPSAILAVMDIVDRIEKRSKAQAVIEAAKQAKADQQLDIYLISADEAPRLLTNLSADGLLDEVAKLRSQP